jgi:hypothetical protein
MLQKRLAALGRSVAEHAVKVLLFGVIVMAVFCFGIKNATMENRVDKLWVEGKNNPSCSSISLTLFG